MSNIIYQLFGSYSPAINPETGEIISGLAGLDIPWIANVILFAIVLSGLMHILTSIVRGIIK